VNEYTLEPLLEDYSDSPDILRQILGIFLEETPQRLDALRSALQSGDRETIAKTAHSLANTTGTVRGENALSIARNAEYAARHESEEEMRDAVHVLLEEVEHMLSVMRDYLNAA